MDFGEEEEGKRRKEKVLEHKRYLMLPSPEIKVEKEGREGKKRVRNWLKGGKKAKNTREARRIGGISPEGKQERERWD